MIDYLGFKKSGSVHVIVGLYIKSYSYWQQDVTMLTTKLVIGHTTRTKALLNRYSHKVMKI